MKKIIFRGAAVAIVTAFKDHALNLAKMGELCERQIAAGTAAIVVAGTTGEASTMPDREHVQLVEEVVRVVAGRVPVIAGTGSNDTVHAVNLAVSCAKAGVDALLCVTPYYNKANQEGLVRHFTETAKAVDLPIILYNVPSRTNCNIAPSTYARLAKLDTVVAVKECNFNQLADVIDLCGDQLSYYSGEDGLVVPLMSLGGSGVISVISNIVPETMAQMTQAFLSGHTEEAARLQIGVSRLIKAMFCDVNPMPIKEAMNMMGLDVGPCRLPLCELCAESRERVRATLKDYGLIS